MASERNNYRSFASQVIMIWSRACSAADSATSDAQLEDALERLLGLRSILTAQSTELNSGAHQAYEQALLVLLEDTVLWAEAKRDGGDVDATRRDMREAHTIVCLEAARLFDTL